MIIANKCKIIEEFFRDFYLTEDYNEEAVSDLVYHNDLGIPLAQAVCYELAELTETGKDIIEETWIEFCNFLDIEADGEYESMEDCLFSLQEYEKDDGDE